MIGPTGLARQFDGLLDWASLTHGRTALVLLLLGLACWLPGFFTLPPIDRDEARFAQASKQMLESGDFITPRFQASARLNKPVGIYWLQALTVGLAERAGLADARTRIALYRLPSLAGALASVLLLYWTGLAFLSRRGAMLAAGLLASCLLLGVEARLAKTDAVLLATVLAGQGALAHAWMRAQGCAGSCPRVGLPLIFWFAMACGLLIRGPMILLFCGTTALAVSVQARSMDWLRPVLRPWGAALVLALCLPWVVAILWRYGDSFSQMVAHDLFGKVTAGQEGHWGPPGFHFLAFWLAFWPAAPLAALSAPMAWRHRREPRRRFLLAWLLPVWLMFEAIATKLPHYVLPLYPALALLAVLTLEEGELPARVSGWRRMMFWWWPGLAISLPALAMAGQGWFERRVSWFAALLMLAGAGLGMSALNLSQRGEIKPGLGLAVTTAVLVYLTVYGAVLPCTISYFPTPQLVAATR